MAVATINGNLLSATNNFTFTNGTTGSDSTIKVKGAARFGLDNVDLGVGSVPQIYNLIQATNAAGVALYVDALGKSIQSLYHCLHSSHGIYFKINTSSED